MPCCKRRETCPGLLVKRHAGVSFIFQLVTEVYLEHQVRSLPIQMMSSVIQFRAGVAINQGSSEQSSPPFPDTVISFIRQANGMHESAPFYFQQKRRLLSLYDAKPSSLDTHCSVYSSFAFVPVLPVGYMEAAVQ
uniref:Uncharacterized protein n=1 Tax=Anguilla anguilla TaxID=7936 RepID=A0A0E9XN76_ANGAN